MPPRYFLLRLYFALTLFLIGTIPKVAASDRHVLVQHTVSSGLPSSTVYTVTQDSKGFIWMGTEAGLTRYDGTDFQTLTIADNLVSNDIFQVLEDREGRYWLRSMGALSYLKDGNIYTPDPPEDTSPPSVIPVRDIAVYQGELYALFSSANTVYKLGPQGWERVGNYPKTEDLRLSKFVEGDGFWVIGPNHFYELGKSDFIPAEYRKNIRNGKAKPIHRKEGLIGESRCAARGMGLLYPSKNQLWLSNHTGSKLLLTPQNLGLENFEIGYIMEDSRGKIWISVKGEGCFIYSKSQLLAGGPPDAHILSGNIINDIFEDNEKNIWLATMRNGVFFLSRNARDIRLLPQQGGQTNSDIQAITSEPDNSVWVGYGNGAIVHTNGQQQRSYMLPGNKKYCQIREIVNIGPGEVLCASERGFFFIGDQVRRLAYRATKGLNIYGDSLLVATTSSFSIADKKDLLTDGALFPPQTAETVQFRQRVYHFCQLPGGRGLLLGSPNGLFVFRNGEVSPYRPNTPLFRSGILDLQVSADGLIWIATHGKGLIVDDGKNYRVANLESGLSSNVCRKIVFDEAGGVLLGTTGGLCYISRFNMETGADSIRKFDVRDGLPTNEISALALIRDSIWIGTSVGIAIMPQKLLTRKEMTSPVVHLNKIKINDRDTIPATAFQLHHRQNNLEIAFRGLDYASPGQLKYRYKMEGLSEDWLETEINEIRFSALPPGQYQFIVQAINKNGGRSEETTLATFDIQPHWTQTSWFLVSVILLVLAVIALSWWYRARVIRRNERHAAAVRERVTSLELQALKAQMNPHFIFNCLGAIQNFIAVNDGRSAHKYLSTFSRLIRRTLEHSNQSLVSLVEEIESIELYLKLEHLRFPDKFDFQVEVSPLLDSHKTALPAMLIQPFIENAIRHGLRHRETKGMLKVAFSQPDNMLICIVEDNGIGREQANLLRNSPSQSLPSRGIDLSRSRLASLQRSLRRDTSLEIIDLYDENKLPTGTRVCIRIPVLTEPSICLDQSL